jgi:hypothetical protein
MVLPSMRTRLGPPIPGKAAGPCAAFAFRLDGSSAPALPCLMRGEGAMLCHDRRTHAWRRPINQLMPFTFTHAKVAVVQPGACQPGGSGYTHGHILVFNIQGAGAAHERELWAYDLNPDGSPDLAGYWFVMSNSTSSPDTTRLRIGSATVASATGRFLFDMGGHYYDDNVWRPSDGPVARYTRTDAGAPAYSACQRSGRCKQTTATSEVRASVGSCVLTLPLSPPSPVVCTRALTFVNLVYSRQNFSIRGDV